MWAEVEVLHHGATVKADGSGSFTVTIQPALAATPQLVDIPLGIITIATGSRGSRPWSVLSLVSELGIVFSHVSFLTGPLHLRPHFDGSSSHIKRLVIESLGLAVNAQIAALYDPFIAPPQHYDLATGQRRGPRPDMLYTMSSYSLAGEARGRSHRRPSTRQMAERLREMALWEAGPAGTQWFVSWATVTSRRTIVDLFDPGDPRVIVSGERVAAVADAWASRIWDATDELEPEPFGGTRVRGAAFSINPFRSVDEPPAFGYFGVTSPDAVPQSEVRSFESQDALIRRFRHFIAGVFLREQPPSSTFVAELAH